LISPRLVVEILFLDRHHISKTTPERRATPCLGYSPHIARIPSGRNAAVSDAHRSPNLWIDETKKAQGSASAALGFLSHLILPASLAATEDMFASDRVLSNPYLSYQEFLIAVKQRFS
jgi:hypothetical protein